MALDDLPADDRAVVLDFLSAVGDDEFVHGERTKSWLTIAPTLEEDNVLTSLAQDEMGHARLWFDLLVESRDATIDDLTIFRPATERRNSTLVERPHADFADAIVRMFLYDEAEYLLLSSLAESAHEELAGRARVALNEEEFHREHVARWLDVFGAIERDEDRERIRRAVESNLAHAGDLFAFEGGAVLADSGVLGAPPASLESEWRATVLPRLAALPIGLDEDALRERLDGSAPNGRRGDHTDELLALTERMRPAEIERLEV